MRHHHDPSQHEPGTPETRVGAFMRVMGHLRDVYGPANRRVDEEELRHQPNPEDLKEQGELDGIDVETDSEGHRYGVRKDSAPE
jgi:hypothetical protein